MPSMSDPVYQVRQCLRPACRFRFPVKLNEEENTRCPKCGSPSLAVELPYTAMRVKSLDDDTGTPVEVLLDNIRSTFNVGAMFRTADGAGIRHMHLCGITPTPDHPKIGKTALGAERALPWTQCWDGQAAAADLVKAGCRLWALEGGEGAEMLFDVSNDLPGAPIVLVVGNEVCGVDPGILAHCERRLYIPMQGVKESLNVAIAFGIAVYFLRYGLHQRIQ